MNPIPITLTHFDMLTLFPIIPVLIWSLGYVRANEDTKTLLSTLQRGQRIKVAGKVLRVEEGGAE